MDDRGNMETIKDILKRVPGLQRSFRRIRGLYTHHFPIHATRRTYRHFFGRDLDLDNPQLFTEKIQWLKLFYYPTFQPAILAGDKVGLRAYLKNLGMQAYCVPLIDVFTDVSRIDWTALPERFVMKKSNASGDVLLVRDKQALDTARAATLMQRWMRDDFSTVHCEKHYAAMQSRIVCEPYLDDLGTEHQVFCFHGQPRGVQLLKYQFSDRSGIGATWRKQQSAPVFLESDELQRYSDRQTADTLLELAAAVSKDIPLVRVDFLQSQGRHYIGELSFTPASGFEDELPLDMDARWGTYLKLPR